MNTQNENKVFLYRFYVGSNNTTHKPEIKKAIRLLRDNGIKGFSVLKNLNGVWEGTQEKSFILEVISDKYTPLNDDLAHGLKTLLEIKLKQFRVLVMKHEVLLLG